MQFVPASGGDSRFDSWVGNMVFSVSNGGGHFEGFRLDGIGKPIFAQGFQPASSTDTGAISGTVYYSTTQSKLVHKDLSGTVHTLYPIPIEPPSLADTDAAAVSNSVYYSTTQSKLVYKDSSDVVHVLY